MFYVVALATVETKTKTIFNLQVAINISYFVLCCAIFFCDSAAATVAVSLNLFAAQFMSCSSLSYMHRIWNCDN